MRLALALGRRAQGTTHENPAVGCVIVDQHDRIVGRGFTQKGGRPHAEPMALTQAGARAKGATVFVTLEPCAHQGQTPPCADALIEAGVAKVVAAQSDLDPRVNGAGFAKLRAAGIEVTTGVLEHEAQRDLAGFNSRNARGRPFLTLKLATSLDGRIATGSGESQWITGPLARKRVHLLRAKNDAILIGGGTARDDDPSLTVRGFNLGRAPIRVVASRKLDLLETSNLARTARETPLWVCHGPDVLEERHARWSALGALLLEVPLAGQQLDAQEMLIALGRQGVNTVLCEGGGMLAASLLHADLVDRIQWVTAGMALGAEGRPGVGPLGLDRLEQAQRFEFAGASQWGQDLMHVWERRNVYSAMETPEPPNAA